MILSYSKNFIFIKNPKTGGSSAEVILSSLCNIEDYFTPIIDFHNKNDDEIIRKEYTNNLPKTHFKNIPIYEHMSSKDVRSLDEEFFNKAYKICVVRHPYEKIISAANHKIHAYNIKENEFKDVLKYVIEVKSISIMNENLYTDDNKKIIVDKIIQYNNLNLFIQNFCYSKTKKHIRLPRCKMFKPCVDISFLTTEQKIEIYNYCQFEFEQFNYDPMLNCILTY